MQKTTKIWVTYGNSHLACVNTRYIFHQRYMMSSKCLLTPIRMQQTSMHTLAFKQAYAMSLLKSTTSTAKWLTIKSSIGSWAKKLYNSLHLYMNTRPSNWQSQVFTFVLGQLITEVHHLVFNAHVNCQGLQEGKNKTHPITNANLVYCSWHTITLFLKAWWKRKEKGSCMNQEGRK